MRFFVVIMSNLIFILGSLVLAFFITFLMMNWGICLFQKWGLGKKIRSEGLVGKATEFAKMHQVKSGTPTMGWIFILVTMTLLIGISLMIHRIEPMMESYFGWWLSHTLWNRQETYIPIFTLMSVGLVGLLDDYLNIREIGRTKWLSARLKMAFLIVFALVGAYWFYFKLGFTEIHIPIFGSVHISYFYIPLFILIFISAANSVNITDGLDGLAGGLLLFQFVAYGFITYSRWLFILSAFCLIIAGALMAFLWFNIHPARIFMGDIGSLSLGATLAVIATMTDTLLAFVVMSSIFILETVSVIIQM